MTEGAKAVTVKAAVLKSFCEEVLIKVGLRPKDASVVSESLVSANLRGVDSHGVIRLSPYVKQIVMGGAKAQPDVKVVCDADSVAVLDGDNALGQIPSNEAAELAIDKAKKTGAGFVGVRNSGHFGAAAYWALKAAKHDMIGISMSNTTPTMAIWGGSEPVIGNNPFAIAIPSSGEFPIVADMATSVVAWGKVFMAAAKGESIPEGWVLKDGHPVTDPNKARPGGVILPFGGHKGSAIAIAVEVLSGVLTGSGFTQEVKSMYENPESPTRSGHFIGAINIEKFMPIGDFKSRMAEFIEGLKSSKPAANFDEVLLPGEPEFREEAKRLKDGIPLPESLFSELEELGRRFGVKPLTT